MKIMQTMGMCLGAVRLAGIDAGFDLRAVGTRVTLPAELSEAIQTEGPHDSTGVGFDGKDGHRYIAWGSVDEIVGTLRENGYTI